MAVIGSGRRAKKIWKKLSASEKARLKLYFKYVADIENKRLTADEIAIALRQNISLKADRANVP